jgi:hypothetical protein
MMPIATFLWYGFLYTSAVRSLGHFLWKNSMKNVHSYGVFFFFACSQISWDMSVWSRDAARLRRHTFLLGHPHKHAAIVFLAVLYKIIAKMPRCCVFVHYNNEKSTNTYFFHFLIKIKGRKCTQSILGAKFAE